MEYKQAEGKMLTVQLTGCENGLGMKIIGGLDPNGNYTGIFVKQIMPDGLVDKDGRINLGDMIHSVNGYNLNRCSQADAISYLRLAAQTGVVNLVVDNSHEAQELFLSLFERPSQDPLALPKPPLKINDLSIQTHQEPDTEKKYSMMHSPSNDSGVPGSSSFTSLDTVADHIKTKFILHETSMGISLRGGINDPDGSNIYIGEIITGGDVYKDGTLKVGDIIISINAESFVGITNEQAKSIMSRIKLKKGLRSYQITYIEKAHRQHANSFLSFAVNGDKNSTIPSSPRKFLPSVPPVSPGKSPKLSAIHKTALIEPEVPDRSLSTERFQSMSSERLGKHDDSLLKELFDVMADVEESGSESGMEQDDESNDDVFTRHMNGFSPNIISTPFRDKVMKSPPHNTISHYLKQDVPSSADEVARKKARRSNVLSLDAHTNIKLEKLEGALQHLGLNPSISQKQEIRRRLHSDINGNVSYGDFVKVAREILQLNGLSDRSKSLKSKTLKFQKSVMDDDTIVSAAISSEEMALSCRQEMMRLRQERDEALKDAQYYRSLLRDRDDDFINLEDELEHTRQQVAVARRECNSLRYHSQKAIEQSQKESSRTVEETIRKLEKENTVLRSHSMDSKDIKDIQKRLVVLGCQLRKVEVSKRAYEVAVDKLTKFVEKVHVNLDNNDSSSSKKSRRTKELSTEAKETIKNVKMLLEEEPLPFGWEEVYAPDGTRYYMNHVTQTTSWVHPISNVSRKPKKKGERKSSGSS